MRLLAIPQSASRPLMLTAATAIVGASAWFTYEKAFNRNPLRMRRDAEGVWRWLTYEEHLAERLQVRARARGRGCGAGAQAAAARGRQRGPRRVCAAQTT
jgi:hypothetical protein